MSGSVTGYSAGVESTDVVLAYGIEAVWGTAPATTFKSLRFTGESLAGSKQRTRPNEIGLARRVSPAVTQQEQAGGGINWNLSYGTFDDLFAGAFGADWGTPLNIVGIAADISTVAAGNKLTSTLVSKFTTIQLGQWIQLKGFTSNNGVYRVTAKASNQDITLAGGTLTNETPAGTSAQVKSAGRLVNGDLVKSYFFEKKFSPTLWLRYPGCIVTGMTLTGASGQFLTGSFTILAKEELNQTTDAATGGIVAAPTGGFFDAVQNFGGVFLQDVPLSAAVTAFSIELTREGAGLDYGMGAAAAQGGRWGQVQVGGSCEIYFKTFTEYLLFKTEQQRVISARMKDSGGNTYTWTLQGANIMNPQIVAGSPNSPVLARFAIEGGNDLALPSIVLEKFDV